MPQLAGVRRGYARSSGRITGDAIGPSGLGLWDGSEESQDTGAHGCGRLERLQRGKFHRCGGEILDFLPARRAGDKMQFEQQQLIFRESVEGVGGGEREEIGMIVQALAPRQFGQKKRNPGRSVAPPLAGAKRPGRFKGQWGEVARRGTTPYDIPSPAGLPFPVPGHRAATHTCSGGPASSTVRQLVGIRTESTM